MKGVGAIENKRHTEPSRRGGFFYCAAGRAHLLERLDDEVAVILSGDTG